MPRNISSSMRRAIEARYSDDVDLVFITIFHPLLSESITCVSDTVDYVRNGVTFTAFPFDITLMSDDDNVPKASITIQNVDRRIGATIRGLQTPPRLLVELMHSLDFDLTQTPRVPKPGAVVEYMADKLFLTGVSVNAMEITASIEGWNYSQRTWPGIRATQNRLPGLFR